MEVGKYWLVSAWGVVDGGFKVFKYWLSKNLAPFFYPWMAFFPAKLTSSESPGFAKMTYEEQIS